jgi:hypothetical protein
MRRPAGVIVAAVVLGLMTCVGLFGTLISFATVFFVHNPALPNQAAVKMIMAVVSLIFLAWFVFCAFVVVGLFRMRQWARYSIIVIGALTAVFGAALCIGMIAVRNFASPQGPAAPANMSIFFIFMGLFYGGIGLIGVWWMVYFNFKSVRLAFAGQATAESLATLGGLISAVPSRSGWHIVVIVYAWLLIFGSISFACMGLLHFPLYLFGMVLYGLPAVVTGVVWGGASLFAGVGLIRRKYAAWWTALVLQGGGLLSMTFFLLPGPRQSMFAAQMELQHRLTPFPGAKASFSPSEGLLLFSFFFGFVVVLVFIIALLRCRAEFAPLESPVSDAPAV